MNERETSFTQLRKSHKRMLHVMTKENACDFVPSEDGTTVIHVGEAYTAANTALLLATTIRLARTSRASKHILAKDVTAAVFHGRLSSDDARAARELRQYLKIALRINTEMFRIYFPEHQFHPDILLGIEAIENTERESEHLPTEDRMLALLQTIRQLGNQHEFVEERSRYRKASGKRLRATKDYITAIFKKCKRQLSVRVDLGYGLQDAYDGQGTVRSGLNFSTVTKHREQLEKALRRSFSKDLSGFVLRLEWAPHKSYHLHLLVLLNGYNVQKGTFYAMKIGSLWKKASGGLGTHWEPEKHKGDTRGTGMIHGENAVELAGLIKAATYLCKDGYYIGYYKGERDKTFFRGEME